MKNDTNTQTNNQNQEDIAEVKEKSSAQQWLDENYPKEARSSIKELDLSGWIDKDGKWEAKPNWGKLIGDLDLSTFPSLEKLDCSFNKITSLNLSNCPNLTELKCWDNQLTAIKLPKSQLDLKILHAWTNYLTELDWNAFNPETLTYISISNNNFLRQNVSVFSKFINLEELYLGNDIEERIEQGICNRFYGSLVTLKDLTKLAKLQIEMTKVKENFEHLSNSNLQITGWYKKNEMIAKTIPLERLYVIRNNIQQFLDKWSKEEDYEWYELNYWKNQSDKEIALSRLKNPDDFSKGWWVITGTQWVNRAALVTGGSLVLVGQSDTNDPNSQLYTQIGGVISITSPFVETITSYVNDQIYETKQKKWDDFLTDAEKFLDNYNELLGVLSQFEKIAELKGTVNKSVKNLNEKVKKFLDIYDGEWDGKKDGEIDIDELTTKRNELVKDLDKEKNSEVQGMIDAIKDLEKKIITYRKFSYYEENIKKVDKPQDTKVELEKENLLDEELEAKIEIPINK